MRKSRFTEEQIIKVLKEHAAGLSAGDVCRKHGISDATFYKWRSRFGGMEISDARKLKALEDENRKLKKLLAETMLDASTLKEMLEKTSDAQLAETCCDLGDPMEKSYSQRRACGLVGLHPKTYRYASTRPDDLALRAKLRELASQRRRFGYRRLGLMLERQGIKLNAKKLYRLYKEERLTVRKRGGRKRALGTRAPMTIPQDRNLRWSLDFVADTLVSGRRFRILTLVDDFTRECLGLVVDTSLTGLRVARELDRIAEQARPAQSHRQRQRHRTHQSRGAALGQRDGCGMALHRARQTDAEWLRRELQ